MLLNTKLNYTSTKCHEYVHLLWKVILVIIWTKVLQKRIIFQFYAIWFCLATIYRVSTKNLYDYLWKIFVLQFHFLCTCINFHIFFCCFSRCMKPTESKDYQRLTKVQEVLDIYRENGIVHILSEHLCDSNLKPPHEYLQCMITQQCRNFQRYRHMMFLTSEFII